MLAVVAVAYLLHDFSLLFQPTCNQNWCHGMRFEAIEVLSVLAFPRYLMVRMVTMCHKRVTVYISPCNTMYHITHKRIAMYYQANTRITLEATVEVT